MPRQMTGFFKRLVDRYFHDEEAIILAMLIIAFVFVMYFFGQILVPILAAFVIAYILTPIADWLTRHQIPYQLANTLVFLLFTGAFLTFVIGVAPMIIRQSSTFIAELPKMARDVTFELQQLPGKYPDFFSDSVLENWSSYMNSQTMSEHVASWAGQLLQLSLQSVPGLLAVGVYLVIVPVLVFFILKDRRNLFAYLGSLLPQRRSLLNKIGIEMNQQLANYIRGKMVEILIVGFTAFGVFWMLDLKYSALLALITGISVLIPYVGAITVTVPVAIVALFQWGLGVEFMWVLISYMILQMLDGNVLVPLIFSEAVNLSATAIIIAVLFFGGLWGFWGVFFAIPLATFFKAIFNAWPRFPAEDRVES